MPEIKTSQLIPFERPLVYRTIRDRMAELLPYMPNVREIEVLNRQQAGEGEIRFTNRWYAAGREIPKPARPFIKPEQVYWIDQARWDESDWSTEFELEFPFFSDAVSCRGRNYYVDEGDETRFEGLVDFSIDLRKVRGIPGFLAKRVGPKVEAWIADMLRPNFRMLPDAVKQFLQENPPEGESG